MKQLEEAALMRQTVTVMVLAAIQADGKMLEELSEAERQVYVDAAVADFKLALDAAEPKS